jgi:hypothetical protein
LFANGVDPSAIAASKKEPVQLQVVRLVVARTQVAGDVAVDRWQAVQLGEDGLGATGTELGERWRLIAADVSAVDLARVRFPIVGDNAVPEGLCQAGDDAAAGEKVDEDSLANAGSLDRFLEQR